MSTASVQSQIAYRLASTRTEPQLAESARVGQQQQQGQQQHSLANAAEVSPSSSLTSAAAAPERQMQDALKYLLHRTEQLSVENGALRSQLVQDGSPAQSPVHSDAGGHNKYSICRADLQQQQQQSLHKIEITSKHSSPGWRRNRSRLQEVNNQSPDISLAHSSGHKHKCIAAARADSIADSEQCQYRNDSSSMYSEGAYTADDVSVTASEDSAAADATTAIECARQRRRARAMAAALQQQLRSPGRAAMELIEQELKQKQQHNTRTLQPAGVSGNSSVLSDICKEKLIRAVGAQRQAHQTANKHSSDSKQLLETVLANLPASVKTGKLLQDLTTAAAASGNAATRGRNSHGMNGSRRSKAGGLVREQLQRLAEMSPGRRQLLRALTSSD